MRNKKMWKEVESFLMVTTHTQQLTLIVLLALPLFVQCLKAKWVYLKFEYKTCLLNEVLVN